MITHELVQGTADWHAYRAAHDNASDAPAMMGVSGYKTRDQLIAERATGIVPEVDAATQRLFDSGHRFEALARPLAEAIIEQDLYPCTGSLEGSRLSASFDGLTMLEDVAFEHKRLNQRLRAALSVPGCTGADLPMEYQIQMEQQCAVSGCERVLFLASDWDDNDQLIEEMHCWYTPNLELRAQIVAGWEQFHKDVAAYVAPEAKPAPVVGKTPDNLPALLIQVTGAVTASNLPEYKAHALEVFTGTQQLYLGREVECQNMARKFAGAFLDGAFVAMQQAAPKAAPGEPGLSRQDDALCAYLADCDDNAITPDVGGAFAWAWAHASVAAPQPAPALLSEREAFEAKFRVPSGVHWDGAKYVADDDCLNSYLCDSFVGQWSAWQVRAALAAQQ